MMTLEDILASLNVTMPSVTTNAIERLPMNPVGNGGSDDLQNYLNNQQDAINAGLSSTVSADGGNSLLNGLKNFNWDSAVNGALTVGTGALNIWNSAQRASQINENNGFKDQIATVNALGRAGYSDYDQIMSAYNNLGVVPRQDYDEVRGMTDAQKTGSIWSGTLTGAGAGAAAGSMFGPWGTAIGGAIGGIAGALGVRKGVREGDRKAQIQTDYDNLQSDLAMNNANINLSTATNRIADEKNRQGQVHFVAEGGNIERMQMDIREFASKVLNKKDYPDRPIRKMVKGGVMIRYKVK